MKLKIYSFFLLGFFILTACVSTPEQFDGVWEGIAVNDQESVPDPADPEFPWTCLPATIKWTIKNGKISGEALVIDEDDPAENYTVSLKGKIEIDESEIANVEAGSGFSIYQSVDFTGTMDEGNRTCDNDGWVAQGTWKASSGCTGTFIMNRIAVDPETVAFCETVSEEDARKKIKREKGFFEHVKDSIKESISN